jgi:FAD/FMN-containing dehydrogenase
MATHSTSIRHVSDLYSALPRKVVLPGDAHYDQARQAFNLAVDQRPSAVVYPESAHDVAAVVRWARGSGQRVAAQTTGHNASPLCSLENTILLKT